MTLGASSDPIGLVLTLSRLFGRVELSFFMNLDGLEFSQPINMDKLKKYYP
ncbi:hypothetical protein ACSBR1_027144 [Camellia fascicularis]